MSTYANNHFTFDSKNYYTTSKTLSLFVVLGACFLPVLFHKIEENFMKDYEINSAILCLFNGLFVAMITYIPFKLLFPDIALNCAVLLGLLISELTVFGNPGYVPGLSLIGFVFLMFYVALEESNHNVFNSNSKYHVANNSFL
jgi:hypothetical protein